MATERILDIEALAADFATAGNSVRLKILQHLSERARTPTELADLLLMEPGALHRHLTRLRNEGWVKPDQDKFYRITDTSRVERIRRAAPELLPRLPPLPDDE